jgi:uncharacterized protein YndB with AHSA1/START domain
MSTTRLTRRIRAPRSVVYRALLDRDAVQQWMVPVGMTSRIHRFEPHEGGTFRISLTYDAPTDAGKTDPQSDTFHGRFVRLVPDAEVVQVVEFETTDPELQGEMTITYALAEAPDGGTDLLGVMRTCQRECGRRRTNWGGACRSTSSHDWSRAPTERAPQDLLRRPRGLAPEQRVEA